MHQLERHGGGPVVAEIDATDERLTRHRLHAVGHVEIGAKLLPEHRLPTAAEKALPILLLPDLRQHRALQRLQRVRRPLLVVRFQVQIEDAEAVLPIGPALQPAPFEARVVGDLRGIQRHAVLVELHLVRALTIIEERLERPDLGRRHADERAARDAAGFERRQHGGEARLGVVPEAELVGEQKRRRQSRDGARLRRHGADGRAVRQLQQMLPGLVHTRRIQMIEYERRAPEQLTGALRIVVPHAAGHDEDALMRLQHGATVPSATSPHVSTIRRGFHTIVRRCARTSRTMCSR
jgi:hypothetical protein